MMLKLLFVYFLFGCVCSFTYSPRYGGWGGRSFSQICPQGSHVDRVQLRTGNYVDALRIHCRGRGWQGWTGGNGGGLRLITAAQLAPEFCGVSVKAGSYVDRLCVRDPSGREVCHGGHGGSWNTQNFCQRGRSNKVLVGIRGRSGWYIDQIQLVWESRRVCNPNQNDWSCCTNQQPCGAGKGDCDHDGQCEGSLVCHHNVGLQNGASSFAFDVCGHPNGRLLQEDEEEPVEAEGCHALDGQEDCEDGESCVFFLPPMDMFDTLSEQGRLFACWNADECTADDAGEMSCA